MTDSTRNASACAGVTGTPVRAAKARIDGLSCIVVESGCGSSTIVLPHDADYPALKAIAEEQAR